MSSPSDFLVWSFAVLSLLVAAAFPVGVYGALRRRGERRGRALRIALLAAAGTAAWLAATYAAAAAGVLAFGPLPPPLAILFVAILLVAGVLSGSRLGEQLALGLPLAALVGVQAFRLPLELLMHRAYEEGVMPVQMSFAGLNYDILTGIGAVVVAVLLGLGRMPLWGVRTWNWMGVLLLINILVIAWLSTPTPLRVFSNEPPNVWITHAPFVWLPSVLVLAALLGHVLVFRRLRAERVPSAARAERTLEPAPHGAAPAR